MAFAVNRPARLSLRCLTTRQASLALRTAQLLPLKGLSTLGSGPARFQARPPACYRAPWRLPGPDFHRQATTSFRSGHDRWTITSVISGRTGWSTNRTTATRTANPVARSKGRKTHAHAADRARSALGYNWRPGRVYFLTLLEPLAGTTGLWPLPPGRPASATVDLPWQGDESFTAHAAAKARLAWIWDLSERRVLEPVDEQCLLAEDFDARIGGREP
jgi:hypothetical protein